MDCAHVDQQQSRALDQRLRSFDQELRPLADFCGRPVGQEELHFVPLASLRNIGRTSAVRQCRSVRNSDTEHPHARALPSHHTATMDPEREDYADNDLPPPAIWTQDLEPKGRNLLCPKRPTS